MLALAASFRSDTYETSNRGLEVAVGILEKEEEEGKREKGGRSVVSTPAVGQCGGSAPLAGGTAGLEIGKLGFSPSQLPESVGFPFFDLYSFLCSDSSF